MESRPYKLLMLEDNPDDAELLVLALKGTGIEFEWSWVATEADYRANLDADLDLIIADYSLPNFGATQALAILQAAELDVPFIVVTGTVSEEAVVEVMKLGAVDYLIKDRLGRLGTAVQHAMEQKRLRAEKRATEAALHESEAQFRTIFDDALDVIMIVDVRTGYMQDVNKAARRLLGYESKALVGRHFSMLFPEESQTVAEHVLNDPRTHDSVIAEQYFARRDGTRVAMDLTVTMIPWKRDRALLVTLRDVTERVQAEAQKMENERVRVELEAERAMVEMRNNFVSMVSHEFRTPLTVITTSKDLLERYNDRLTAEKRAEHLKKIGDQARHMADMIDDILLLNRGSAGVSSPHYELVDIEAFCRDVSEHVVMAWPSHELKLEFAGDLRRVRTSPQALDHIITNLLSNAFKYSAASSTVLCRAERGEDELVISVHDDGIGIDADAIERLFEPFYRAPNSQNVRGTGLGLAIVKQHIDQLNGVISVESHLGKGTTFTVRIPI